MKKDIELSLLNTQVFERYGISMDTELSGKYLKLLVNSETVDFLRKNCKDERRVIRWAFILHLARYRISKKIGRVIYRTLTSSKTEKSRLLKELRAFGLLDHSGYWPGHESAEYHLQGLAEAEGAYSFTLDDSSVQDLIWTIYRKEMKSIEAYNYWEGIQIPKNWKSLVDISDIENLEDLERLIDGINQGVTKPNKKTTQELRLYSAFSSLNKIVRPLLSSRNGSRFCLIDVKTSQPRLMPLVFREMLGELLLNEFALNEYRRWSRERNMMIREDNSKAAILGDIERLQRYFSEPDNDFYSDLGATTGTDREIVKTNIMVFLNNNYSEQKREVDSRLLPIDAFFRNQYPDLFCFILYCKNQEYRMKKCAKSKGNWKYYRFSPFYRLTSLESELVLDESCSIFRQNHPNTNLITIHDGIMVEAQHVEAMKSILVNAYGLRGAHAALTIEDYTHICNSA